MVGWSLTKDMLKRTSKGTRVQGKGDCEATLEERRDQGWSLACERPPSLEGWVLAQILLPEKLKVRKVESEKS